MVVPTEQTLGMSSHEDSGAHHHRVSLTLVHKNFCITLKPVCDVIDNVSIGVKAIDVGNNPDKP